jgi:hypothetical protein
MSEILANEKLAPLSAKLSLGVTTNQSFEMLTNNSYPTDQEKELIKMWFLKRDFCVTSIAEEREKALPPEINAINNKEYALFRGMIADLYLSKITYGEFAKMRQNNAAIFLSERTAAAITAGYQESQVRNRR